MCSARELKLGAFWFLATIDSKDLWGNPKSQVSPDQTKPGPGRGTYLRIFSGQVGSENFILGWFGWEYFLMGYGTFFPGISGINLNLNYKYAFCSQTEQVERLLSLISMSYYHVITTLQGIFTCLL